MKDHRQVVVRPLQRDHIGERPGEPSLVIFRMKDRDHRLRIDRRNKFVRITRHHREPGALLSVRQEPGHREQWADP
jgi:hypothetical protein